VSLSASQIEQSFGFLLNDISRLARRQFDRRVRSLQLTRAQWLFLYYLARSPGCTQSELAEHLQIERISVSRQAERLERSGWIERRDHNADARAYQLVLTPKAERTVARLSKVAAELREDYLRGLPPSRRSALMNDLLRIKNNLLRLEAGA
jgi:DNA-binding MarR family transcriptional regulator